MNSAHNAAVVVGVDGSPQALRAVGLAATQAHRHQRPLRVVHAFIWPRLHLPTGGPSGSALRPQAEQLVTEAVDTARRTIPDLPVTGEIIDGEASAVLLGEAPTAAMIVLGDRGLGGFGALLVGSVAVQVTTYAPGPVLIARGADHPHGPVVVGVDGSPVSAAAVDFAAQEATLRGTDLVALHAYRHPTATSPGDMQPVVYDKQRLRQIHDQIVADAVADLTHRLPDLTVHRHPVPARTRTALLDASRQAQLLVVGGHGHGALGGLLLGSVSQAVLHHSACPVAVVRAPH
ncbi:MULTISPECIES: universal stress protein [Micromonospora]|uniref:Nucleotide-binding universal stress protein, UspA family n=1 Tax=Micromonospora yangpuensis TaxID=683228 RepID=A0A1C6UQI0_9ACTN|nr:universal stress protein [Micromonospora yangpuensis]GGM07544.1 universal stress protein [Micromonospora yangpuensis]SCL56327.1 Nucleotide-binding universal stress protein, UspA family [Micromonospora yangpuensis]